MNPEITQLKKQVQELLEWKEQRMKQQISFPLDDASRATIGGVRGDGLGSTALTQSISLSGDAESITVPKGYLDTVLILIDGVRYEIPYLAIV